MVNINQFLKQAQTMQKKMQETQEKLGATEYSGKAGGGLVNITINGRWEIKKLDLDPSLLKPEEKEILEDLIIAAFNEAKAKVDEESQNSFGNMGGMQMPAGFKLPF